MSRPKKSYKQRLQLLKKFAKRLSAYSAAAAATTVSLHSTGNAEEVVWDIPDLTITAGKHPREVPEDAIVNYKFNMKTGAYGAATSSSIAPSEFLVRAFTWKTNQGAWNDRGVLSASYNTSAAFVGQENAWFSYYPGVDPLGSGVITPDQNFVVAPYTSNFAALGAGSQSGWGFVEGQTAFVGLRFEIDENTHYGWAQLTRDAESDDYILHGFGYNDVEGASSRTTDTVDIIGDINEDGKVDDADLNLLLSSFENPPSAQNQIDLAGLLDNFGYVKESATTSVPEPSSIMLLAAGAAGLVGWRRKRSRKAA